jgi:hypothetical protein
VTTFEYQIGLPTTEPTIRVVSIVPHEGVNPATFQAEASTGNPGYQKAVVTLENAQFEIDGTTYIDQSAERVTRNYWVQPSGLESLRSTHSVRLTQDEFLAFNPEDYPTTYELGPVTKWSVAELDPDFTTEWEETYLPPIHFATTEEPGSTYSKVYRVASGPEGNLSAELTNPPAVNRPDRIVRSNGIQITGEVAYKTEPATYEDEDGVEQNMILRNGTASHGTASIQWNTDWIGELTAEKRKAWLSRFIVFVQEVKPGRVKTVKSGSLLDFVNPTTLEFTSEATISLHPGGAKDGMVKSRNLTLLPVEVVPDYNRDGKIDDADRYKVTETNPWRWWVNDDDDGGELKDADIPRHVGDGADLVVNELRDLVDWFPVWLNIGQLLQALPASDYDYVLKSEEFALNTIETILSQETAGDFIRADLGAPTERNNPNGFISVATPNHFKRVQGNNAKLSEEFLAGIVDGSGGVLLLEAHDETTKPLRLAVREKGGGNELVNVPILPLRISQVEKMYRHIDLRSVAKNPDGSNAGGQPSSFPGHERIADPGDPYPDELTNGKYFVFIHGFNVPSHRARGWNAEIFKRLHQMGSRARFIGMSWHGDTGLIVDGNSTNYHQAVFHAFQTGDALASKLAFASGDLTVAAHSLGNVVASHAISEGGLSPARYYMINAAAPLEAYNPAGIPASQQLAMTEESWEDYGAMQHLFAARWHELFEDEGDPRRDLTWKDRFAALLPKAFNSTGEDVVQNPQTNSASLFANGIQNTLDGRGAWGAQEFAKGVWGQKF